VPPSAKELERAIKELRRLNSRHDWLLHTYRGSDLLEFLASLQDNLNAIAHRAFLSRMVRAMLAVVSALRVEGD
jgi:hypothetical protein